MAELASGFAEVDAVSDVREEFAELCRAVHPRLVGSLSLRCGDRQLAEDLAQEALARAWQHRSKLRAGGADEPWVFTTAFNLLRSWHRRLLTGRRRGTLLEVRSDSAAGSGDPYVRDAVACLPPRQREVIALRFYADLSIRDAATAMGCAEGTVRALTSQAVSALRTALGPEIQISDVEDQS